MKLLAPGRSAFSGLVAGLTALALLLAISSSAHAEEHLFCYGKNLGGGETCSTATWPNMYAAYVNSPQAPVCLQLAGGEGFYNCMGNPNEGLYINESCGSHHATIFNWTAPTKTVYGEFWTC